MAKDKKKEALEIVQQEISDCRTKYEAITLTNEELDPVLAEGETKTGYYCHLFVDPKEVARVFLKHDYPVWLVLEEDAPKEMWDELAELYGLAEVVHVDI